MGLGIGLGLGLGFGLGFGFGLGLGLGLGIGLALTLTLTSARVGLRLGLRPPPGAGPSRAASSISGVTRRSFIAWVSSWVRVGGKGRGSGVEGAGSAQFGLGCVSGFVEDRGRGRPVAARGDS